MDTKLKLEFSLYRKSTLSSCKQVRKNPGLNGFQTHNGMIAQHLLLWLPNKGVVNGKIRD